MLYEKVYGTASIGYRHSNAQIIENPVLEKLPEEAEKLQSETVPLEENKQKVNLTPTKVPLPVSNKQIETRTSDGRRRITPIFIAPAPDIGYALPETSNKIKNFNFNFFFVFVVKVQRLLKRTLSQRHFQALAKKKVKL